jgi:hypothetical protein
MHAAESNIQYRQVQIYDSSKGAISHSQPYSLFLLMSDQFRRYKAETGRSLIKTKKSVGYE